MRAKIAASLWFALLVFCSCRDDGNTVNGNIGTTTLQASGSSTQMGRT
jgi:hypothetical protein